MGHDVELFPNVYLYGDTVLGNGVTVMPGAFLENVTVKDGAIVNAGVYRDCELG